ncbi:heavy metal translocating P-type ATPase, partial [Alcaligenes faecalis subsp. faecalis NCIB 8687]
GEPGEQATMFFMDPSGNALGIKELLADVLTFTGQATMWMAVFADMGASLLVVGNGLRLLRK